MRTFPCTVVLALTAFFAACRKSDVSNPRFSEAEGVTTVNLIIADSSGAIRVHRFFDPDGPGGVPARYGTSGGEADSLIRLRAVSAYTVTMEVWNDSEVPAEELTGQYADEGYQVIYGDDANGVPQAFPYSVTDDESGVMIEYLDTTPDGKAAGFQTVWITGQATTGFKHFHVILLHAGDEEDAEHTEHVAEVLFRIRVD